MHREIGNEELDAILAEFKGPPERFEEELEQLLAGDEIEQCDLEMVDSSAWRKPAVEQVRCTFESQFRADVRCILVLDRDQELRLAKRLQFARLRLKRAAERWGVGPEARDDMLLASGAPSNELERRAAELQRLRVELVERNLYLVLLNVERYARRGGSREDLIQEACIALFKAVDRFDWKRGLLFRTYAVHWLNQAFRNYLYNQSHTVRVPVYLQKALKHINQATIRLGKENASPEELAASSDLPASLVRSAIAAARGSYSLDTPSDADESLRLGDSIVDENAEWGYSTRLEAVSLASGLDRALLELPERDRHVIEMRFGIGQEHESTLAEVASLYGISLERVRQIQARALNNLGTVRLRRELEPFLN